MELNPSHLLSDHVSAKRWQLLKIFEKLIVVILFWIKMIYVVMGVSNKILVNKKIACVTTVCWATTKKRQIMFQ
jgi:flagellar biogenesis protein FliO